MATKRDRKPREPQPEPVPDSDSPEDVFSDVLTREPQPEALPDDAEVSAGTQEEAFAEILGRPAPPTAAVPPAIPAPEPGPGGTVDGYLLSRVLMDLYGTETPSEYDKISLAIRRML